MATFRELLARTKSQINEIDVEVASRRRQSANPVFVDVREPDEYEQGAVPGAVHIPGGYLQLRIEEALPDRDAEVIVYCAGGTRSAFAAKVLQDDMGYTNVTSLIGGFNAWKTSGQEWKMPAVLNAEQRLRYGRHILLPEVGEAGQIKLLESKVLLLGAGGLGSPSALYLAAAGIGTLGIVDFDVVDTSNLQRQILHNDERVGMPKVESARQTLTALNPDIKVEAYNTRVTKENVLELMRDYDVIVDGGDNFPLRYLVNDASVLLGKPVVHGSIFRFEGQVSIFWPGEGPCYRCLYRQPPPPELAPSCAEGGVLGVLPGIIGSLEAVEALKLILGIGEPLIGRLLTYDALEASFRTLKLRRDPECPTCSPGASVELVDYDDYCAPGNLH
jgi:molybdopterin/thiamine biosynthesis adenylyltransferase/rhodanese-related sulfurtransferase